MKTLIDDAKNGVTEPRSKPLYAWLARLVRGRSLPIVATLLVLLLGLPDQLVDVLRELPCDSGIAECCDLAADTCDPPSAATSSQGASMNILSDQLRDIVVDWISRIWAILF